VLPLRSYNPEHILVPRNEVVLARPVKPAQERRLSDRDFSVQTRALAKPTQPCCSAFVWYLPLPARTIFPNAWEAHSRPWSHNLIRLDMHVELVCAPKRSLALVVETPVSISVHNIRTRAVVPVSTCLAHRDLMVAHSYIQELLRPGIRPRLHET
jgi:hypothetical protein